MKKLLFNLFKSERTITVHTIDTDGNCSTHKTVTTKVFGKTVEVKHILML